MRVLVCRLSVPATGDNLHGLHVPTLAGNSDTATHRLAAIKRSVITLAMTNTVKAMQRTAFAVWPAAYIAGNETPTSFTPAVIVVLTTKSIGRIVTGA